MNTHDDLGDSLKITKTEGRQLNALGTWVSGTIAGHTFQALVFEDHAENADYELGTSRISKLWLRRQTDRQVVANFDRGWDVVPTTRDARMIVDFLAAGIAEHTFGH
ncbi:MAG: hypothetical protein JNM43_11675 [Planctomycetaceae bacterium]|nr:hypothetical protein [Planctomycetaceae bacterium]